MKLIIDIDEAWYSNILASKDHIDEDSEAYLILNGVPYEERPQGDLKSCEALKAYARKVICGDNPTNSLIIRMFDEIISNAPSVYDNPYSDGREDGYIEGYEAAKRECERPQGEWKLDSLGAYCSECGTHPDYSSNYCPNCGASMEGGTEE